MVDGGCATNLTNFLVSNILVPDGCNLGVADLIGSMNLLKYNAQAGEPKALNLVEFPPEAQSFRQFVVQRMETLAGINAQVRGMPDENITSGSQSALQDARAIKFNSRFAKAWAQYCADLATGILHDLQDHPEDQRTGLVAGKGNRCYLKEFYGSDVNLIDRVNVTLGSAYANTDAGRIEIAKDMVGSGLISDPKEYLEVIETGSLEPLTEGPHRELMLIKGENEKLSEGGMCKAAISDDHPTHILEHKNVIADPGLRLDNSPDAAKIVQNTLTHIAEHEMLMQQCIATRPILAGVLKLLPQAPPPGQGAPHPQQQPPQKKPMPQQRGAVHPQKPMPVKPQAGPARPMMKKKVPNAPGQPNTVAMPNPAQAPSTASAPRA
jgi:hypothetical protein